MKEIEMKSNLTIIEVSGSVATPRYHAEMRHRVTACCIISHIAQILQET